VFDKLPKESVELSKIEVELNNAKELSNISGKMESIAKRISSLGGKAKDALNTLQELRDALKEKESTLDDGRQIAIGFRNAAKELGIDVLNSDVYKDFEKAKKSLMEAEKGTGVPYSLISKI